MKLQSQCQYKRRYSDESDARAGALMALESTEDIYILYIYKCPLCAGWHLTKSINDNRYKIVKQSAPDWIK